MIVLADLAETGDVVEQGRAMPPTGTAVRKIEGHFVARDDTTPPAFVQQVEKRKAPLGETFCVGIFHR
ncbi:hypothetical protein D3C86_2180990 [compost metagenome]